MFPLPPAVVDADVLIRNVDYAIRKSYPGALFGFPSPRYSLFSGVALFASTTVHGEAIRHFPDVAARRGVPEEVVWKTWNQLVLPAVRFVSLGKGAIEDPRIEGVDPADRPTAELASLLAPAVLLTDNRKHFRSFGLARTKTDTVAIDLFQVGQFTVGAKGVAFIPTVGGAALIEGVKKLAAKFGIELTIVIGLLGIVGTGYFLVRPRGREMRGRLADAGRRAMPLIAEQAVAAMQASERVEGFAIERMASPDAVSLLARHLAVRQSSMSTDDVSKLLKELGFGFSGGHAHQTETRAWLERELCFSEVERGRWALGFYAKELLGARSELAPVADRV
jgi:hypothetical protein